MTELDAANKADLAQITEQLKKENDEKNAALIDQLNLVSDQKQHLEDQLNRLYGKVSEWKDHGFIPEDYQTALKNGTNGHSNGN